MKVTVRIDEQEFEVEVGDLNGRPILAQVDGETFEVWPEEAQPGATLAPAAAPRPAPRSTPLPARTTPAPAAANGGNLLTAPLPGTIITLAVKAGDKVTNGQEVLVLEAMKMKNSIRSTRSGVIRQVFVAAGDQVKHGQPLIEYGE